MTRRADVKRQTAETSILVSMDLDGSGKADIRTGIGFFDHMLHADCTPRPNRFNRDVRR